MEFCSPMNLYFHYSLMKIPLLKVTKNLHLQENHSSRMGNLSDCSVHKLKGLLVVMLVLWTFTPRIPASSVPCCTKEALK